MLGGDQWREPSFFILTQDCITGKTETSEADFRVGKAEGADAMRPRWTSMRGGSGIGRLLDETEIGFNFSIFFSFKSAKH